MQGRVEVEVLRLRGRNRAASGAGGLGSVHRPWAAGTGGAASWMRPPGEPEGGRRGAFARPPGGGRGGSEGGGNHAAAGFSSSGGGVLRPAPGARVLKVPAPGREGADVETWKEKPSQIRLQPSCIVATRTHAGHEPAGHSVP